MSIFERPKKLQDWFDRVKADRSTTENQWQLIADNQLGRRDFTNQRYPGEDRYWRIYDTTALFANQLLAGGLHGLLTSPATAWFELQTTDPRLMEDVDVRGWLEDTRNRTLMLMNSASTGFTANIAEVYMDVPGFGMSGLWIDEDDQSLVSYSYRPLRELYVERNQKGEIDVVFRECEPTARQFKQRFPNSNIDQVEKALKKDDPEQKIKARQIVARSDDPYAGTSPFRKLWTSVVWADGKNGPELVERKGYDEKPILTPRWEVEDGESYGRGPGWVANPAAMSLNVMMKTIIKAGQKAADPPLLVTDEAVLGGLRTNPGGVNYVQSLIGIGGAPEAIRPLDNRARVDISDMVIQRMEQQVRDAYWSAVLQMHSDPRMSATQVLDLASRAQRMMAPMLGRMHQELLEPTVDRTISIGMRRGLYLPAPTLLRGQQIRVSYVSPVSRSQRQSEAQSVVQTWQAAALVAEASRSQEALDVLDPERSVRLIAEANAVPAIAVRTVAEVQQAQQERAQLMAEQQGMAQAGQGAEILKTLSEAQAAPVAEAA